MSPCWWGSYSDMDNDINVSRSGDFFPFGFVCGLCRRDTLNANDPSERAETCCQHCFHLADWLWTCHKCRHHFWGFSQRNDNLEDQTMMDFSRGDGDVEFITIHSSPSIIQVLCQAENPSSSAIVMQVITWTSPILKQMSSALNNSLLALPMREIRMWLQSRFNDRIERKSSSFFGDPLNRKDF